MFGFYFEAASQINTLLTSCSKNIGHCACAVHSKMTHIRGSHAPTAYRAARTTISFLFVSLSLVCAKIAGRSIVLIKKKKPALSLLSPEKIDSEAGEGLLLRSLLPSLMAGLHLQCPSDLRRVARSLRIPPSPCQPFRRMNI